VQLVIILFLFIKRKVSKKGKQQQGAFIVIFSARGRRPKNITKGHKKEKKKKKKKKRMMYIYLPHVHNLLCITTPPCKSFLHLLQHLLYICYNTFFMFVVVMPFLHLLQKRFIAFQCCSRVSLHTNFAIVFRCILMLQ
jgi:hypothetical protein